MKITLLFILLLIAITLFGQTPSIEWQKSFGSSGADRARSIDQTSDGGYVVAGFSSNADGDVSESLGQRDYWVIKQDASGSIEWEKSFGGSSGDEAYSIQQTSDGGFIVAGISQSTDGDVSGNNGSNDYWILKLDGLGNIQWEKSYGGNSAEGAYSIQQTTDGGYIVAGYSESTDGDVSANNGGIDYWILKLDNLGNIQWEKSYGGGESEEAYSIQQTNDGGYVVAGRSNSNNGDVSNNNGDYDYWIIKLDAVGNIVWDKSLGGSKSDWAQSIQQTNDGGYIVVGNSKSNNGDVTDYFGDGILQPYGYWVVKLDEFGNILWQNFLGGSLEDWARSVEQLPNGDYIVAGYSESTDGDVSSNNGAYDYWIVRLNQTGGIMWEESFGGSNWDWPQSIKRTTDGGYIVAGRTRSDDFDVSTNNGATDFWIVKLSPDILNVDQFEHSFNVYPNPSLHKFTIDADNPINSKFKMIDCQGRVVLIDNMNGVEKSVDISRISNGVYSIIFDNSELPVLSVIVQ